MSAYLIITDLITLPVIGEECKLWSTSLCSLLHSPITPFLRFKYSQHLILSNTPNLCFSFRV